MTTPIVYCNLIRQTYKKTPIIIGGIEASLRRMGHYDYWSDKVRRSVLLDAQADLLLYGMGERSIVEVADALNSGLSAADICFINGTVYKARSAEDVTDAEMLPSFAEICADKKAYAESFYTQYLNTDHVNGRRLVEQYDDHTFVVQNPPQAPLTTQEMDDVYSLPYTRKVHPMNDKGVAAIEEVRFSLVSTRGCFGACSFCALTFHQGRIIQKKSKECIVEEAKQLTQDPAFKGYIHDVGGPTANFRHPSCAKQTEKGVCRNRQCLYPAPCRNIDADHSEYIDLLRALRKLPKVRKVFVRSGLRFDYMLADKNDSFLRELCEHHISGQLKIAPEHISDKVLGYMGKAPSKVYLEFAEKYRRTNEKLGKKQYLVPYLMSSHPGCTLKDAVTLAEHLRDFGYMPEQVQDFYPTPSTISTCMYYTGIDPRTMEKVFVTKNPHEKAMQRALMQYKNPANYELVYEALVKAGRRDLIGFDRSHCLILPKKEDIRPPRAEKPQKRKKPRQVSKKKNR